VSTAVPFRCRRTDPELRCRLSDAGTVLSSPLTHSIRISNPWTPQASFSMLRYASLSQQPFRGFSSRSGSVNDPLAFHIRDLGQDRKNQLSRT